MKTQRTSASTLASCVDRAPGALLTGTILLFLSISHLDAATFNVASGSVNQLKHAINTANNNNEYDVINLAAGGTYTLDAADNNDGDGANGLPVIQDDLPIFQALDVTINGNGATLRRATGESVLKFRLLRIAAGATCIINNLTIEGGHTPIRGGGGVLNQGRLSLNGCTLRFNSVVGVAGAGDDCGPVGGEGCPGFPARGGAIYSTGAFLTATGCSFVNNTATGGRGANSSSRPGGKGGEGAGGAIYAPSGNLTVSNCSFSTNSANGGAGGESASDNDGYFGQATGGAVEAANGKISGSTFASNSAVSRRSPIVKVGGGALNMLGGTMSAENCSFTQNSAHSGGAIHIMNENSDTNLTLTRCTFDRNGGSETGLGGAICNIAFERNSRVTINESTFRENTAELGGAIYNSVQFSNSGVRTASVEIRGSTFTLNQSVPSPYAETSAGGAIYNLNDGSSGLSQITLANSTLSGNAGDFGGGIFNQAYQRFVGYAARADVIVRSSTLHGNIAFYGDEDGGGAISNNLTGSGTANLRCSNTIFNASLGANLVNKGGSILSEGHNLSSDAAGGGGGTGPGGFLNQPGDLRNTNPRLHPLASNGGPTQTHVLNTDSPAINRGGGSEARDQRGYFRTDPRDMGAFETGVKFIGQAAVAFNGTDVIVRFDAVDQNAYRIEYKLELTDPWQPVPGVAPMDADENDTEEFTHPGGANLEKAFYRVVWTGAS